MFFKNSPFSIQKSNTKNFDNSTRKYPSLDDLLTEKNITGEKSNTVHRRRDLDSLG